MKNLKLLGLMLMALTLFSTQSCKKDEACEEKTWYHDEDADGEGDSGDTKKACDKPAGYVANANDPDDTNTNIFSSCTKVTYYLDNDGDTFGDPDQSLELCDGVTPPEKYISDNTDCDDTDPDIHPDVEVTVYLDNDGDEYGNPETSQTVSICSIPDNHVIDNTDCNDEDANINPGVEITIYFDSDGDGFGDPLMSQTTTACTIDTGYVTNGDDCDDSNFNVNPEAEEIANDGIDNNCDGYLRFSKSAQDDWTDPQYQDKITEKVTLTRQDNDYLFNLTWWEENIGNAPIHDGENGSDLAWEFWGTSINPVSNIAGHDPTGGTKGVRWALLDIDTPDTESWNDFEFYGALGENTHFYSWHNVASIALRLDQGIPVNGIIDDFIINYASGLPSDKADMTKLTGKTLGVWLVEENIYFTLKFTEWTSAGNGGSGTISYERSTPIAL